MQTHDLQPLWDALYPRKDELLHELAQADLDQRARHTLQKELAQVNQLLEVHEELEQVRSEYNKIVQEAQHTDDPELQPLLEEEQQQLSDKLEKKKQELNDLLYPPSELDERSAFLEIRSGAGGQEAALFAADLLEMYLTYALQQGWKTAIIDSSPTDLGGYREVIVHIQGKNIYGFLKWESGVHRVQRVPRTETGGRVHTSTATVAVMPEAEEIDVTINQSDLRMDTFRASGSGGQHVNTTDSAVRITHIPTGTIVACQDERSQHKNREKAMKMLQARLFEVERQKQQAQQTAQRRQAVGSGARAEKVRTYNFPQNRVTDHQANFTSKKLDMVMQGEMQDIIDALQEKDRHERYKHSSVISRYAPELLTQKGSS